jgi:raffinose/stachyose/melibiose transport system permease protein
LFRVRHLDGFGLFCRGFALVWAVVILYPVGYVISLSLRRASELNLATLGLIPHHVRWQNFPDAFKLMSTFVVSIPKLMTNSAIVAGTSIVVCLAAATLASYAFARLQFVGRRLLFYLLLLGLIVPIPVMLIPEFITIQKYGLIGTRWSLILPYIAFGLPIPTLILTTFFRRLPKEMFEAADLDGASHLRTLVSVVLPLSVAPLVTSGIFLALQFWNEFPLALTLIQNPSLSTVPLGLASVQGKGVSAWQLVAVVILVTSIPVVILFSIFQKRLVRGVGEGGVKA